jgi:hypothetical protein
MEKCPISSDHAKNQYSIDRLGMNIGLLTRVSSKIPFCENSVKYWQNKIKLIH